MTNREKDNEYPTMFPREEGGWWVVITNEIQWYSKVTVSPPVIPQ